MPTVKVEKAEGLADGNAGKMYSHKIMYVLKKRCFNDSFTMHSFIFYVIYHQYVFSHMFIKFY